MPHCAYDHGSDPLTANAANVFILYLHSGPPSLLPLTIYTGSPTTMVGFSLQLFLYSTHVIEIFLTIKQEFLVFK